MRRLRPNSVSSAITDRQFDCTLQSPQPSQTSSLMTTRLSGACDRAALALAVQLGRAGLVVDQRRHARDLAQLALQARRASRRWCTVTAGGKPARARYFSGWSVTTMIGCTPSAASCCATPATRQVSLDRLAAGHRDRVVEQDLVGHVHAGRDGRADRERCRSARRCRRRGSGTRACVSVNGAWPIQVAPSPPICV